jgi:hypothetical protein
MRDYRPIDSLTADELRQRAQEYRKMVESATSPQTGDALLRLAEQFEALALARPSKSAAG